MRIKAKALGTTTKAILSNALLFNLKLTFYQCILAIKPKFLVKYCRLILRIFNIGIKLVEV